MSANSPTGATSSLRRTHRGLTLRHLLVEGVASRTDIAERLGLSQMAASRIVRELIEVGLVEEAGLASREAGPGRYAAKLRLSEHGVYAAGITFSAYSTEVAIVGGAGGIVAQRTVDLGQYDGGGAAIAMLSDALVELIEAHSIPRERLVGVGVAVAAHFDAESRRVVSAGYLGLEPFDLIEPIVARTGLPVVAENIARALTLAEAAVGVARDLENVVVVRCATTIGATMLHKGQIVRGHGNRAGQIGHLHQRSTALTCSCGRNDCLNCTASGWSVLVAQAMTDGSKYNPKHVQRYARAIEGIAADFDAGTAIDAKLSRTLRTAGGALADALATIDQMIDPEAIVLLGSMPRIGDYHSGIERRLTKLGDIGEQTLDKIRIGKIRAVRAAALLVLLEKVYSSNLDIAALQVQRTSDDGASIMKDAR